MKNKIMKIGICFGLVLLLTNTLVNSVFQYNTVNAKEILEQEDQKQLDYDCQYGLVHDRWICQSFIPTLGTLSKITIRITDFNPYHEYWSGDMIRFSVHHYRPTASYWDPIAVREVNIDSWVYDWPDSQLYCFEFDDVYVSVGSPYYIVITGESTDINHHFGWTAISSDEYQYGYYSCFHVNEGLWEEIYSSDMTFITYGIPTTNHPPSTPDVSGPTTGNPGTQYDYYMTSYDTDDDEIKYTIDWGDGSPWTFTDFYPQGQQICRSHTWSDQGSYTVRFKATDFQGDESDWRTIPVSMPLIYIESGFIAGTQVTIYDPFQQYKKNIEQIKIGDIIMSYDEQTQMPITAEVIDINQYTRVPTKALIQSENLYLDVSGNKNIYADGKWMLARETQENYEILTYLDGQIVPRPINDVHVILEYICVYDLVIRPIEGDNGGLYGYWANDILVLSAPP